MSNRCYYPTSLRKLRPRGVYQGDPKSHSWWVLKLRGKPRSLVLPSGPQSFKSEPDLIVETRSRVSCSQVRWPLEHGQCQSGPDFCTVLKAGGPHCRPQAALGVPQEPAVCSLTILPLLQNLARRPSSCPAKHKLPVQAVLHLTPNTYPDSAPP